ncbi:MAG: hypothetical protein V8T65_03775 [Roseburia inulinivorans]
MGMEKYAKTIIPIIEANYERYTETERYIADYFLKNDARSEGCPQNLFPRSFPFRLRHCQDLPRKADISGYREFVYEYRNSYVEKTTVEQEESQAGFRHVSEPVE